MKRSVRRTSIIGRLGHSTRTTAIMLLIPALASLAMMFLTTVQYQRAMSRMETAAGLKPIVGTQLPEQLFSVAAGRLEYDDSGADDLLGSVNETLDRLLEDASTAGTLELTVARRTMDTLASYLGRLRDGMAAGAPVGDMERIVDEVRDVGDLITDMLDDFISVELDNAVRAAADIRRAVWLSGIVEALLLMVALVRAASVSTNLANTIRMSIMQATQINVMANRLESLIERSRLEQENLAKSELRLLQAQINPHFLYNTLDAIIWQAQSGKSEEVIHLTRALSDFFRISLSSGADWIPLEKEALHLSGYLSIQKTRYRDILNYEIDIPEALMGGYIVKMLLQPLVENALYHGIKSKRGGGMIRVSARAEGAGVRFTVADTGKGMAPEELEGVVASLRSAPAALTSLAPVEGGSFGLRNVDMRIRLYYRQPRGLEIESGPTGTVVSFCVPLKSREEIADDEGISG